MKMSVKVFIVAYRKPGLSLEEFKKHYEAHIDLIKRLSGDDFPLSHRRSYISRTTVETALADVTARNATTPATVITGKQSDFDFDATAELTFVDQAAFQAFGAKISTPDAAAQIAADEERFLDRSKLGIAMLGDVIETSK
jgi:EthD domain